MARKRMIDPGIWDSEQVMGLTPDQFKIYIYLISHADDEGRLRVSPRLWRTRIFPFNSPSPERFEKDFVVISEIGLIRLYRDGEGMYCYHPNWKRYQKIDRATESKLPVPPKPSVDTRRALDEPSTLIEVNRIEVNRKEDNTCRDSDESGVSHPLSEKEQQKKQLGIDAKACLDYYFQKHVEVREFEPTIEGGRDMAIFKRLLKGYSVGAIKQVIDFFFAYKQRSKFTTRALTYSFDTLYGVMLDKVKGKRA